MRSRSFDHQIADLRAVGLDEIIEIAALRRFDQKYLVRLERLGDLLTNVDRLRVLEVDQRRCIPYSSVYFDSADMSLYRAHRQGRRRRYKVRTRHYGNRADTMLEVKLKSQRGETIKHRQPHAESAPDILGTSGREFVTSIIEPAYGPIEITELTPVVTTTYTRTTLVDVDSGVRLTVDRNFSAHIAGRSVDFGERFAIVESKSVERLPEAHRALLRVGARPQRLSKYCLGAGALLPDLASNRWQHQLRQLLAHSTDREHRHPMPLICAPSPSQLLAQTSQR